MSLSSIISRLLFQTNREVSGKNFVDDGIKPKHAFVAPLLAYDNVEMKAACNVVQRLCPYSIGIEVPEDYLRRQYEGKGVCLPDFFTPLALYCRELGITVVPLLSSEDYNSACVIGHARVFRSVSRELAKVPAELQRLKREHNGYHSPQLISDPLRIYERILECALQYVHDKVDLDAAFDVCAGKIKTGMVTRVENARPDLVFTSGHYVDDVIKQVNDRNARYVLEILAKA